MLTKQKGDIALGKAISHYLSNGYEVCLPIGDKRHYDLIIEKEGMLLRVQVKYAGLYTAKNICKVGLRITGGNQSFNYSRKYNDDAFDVLFVYTARAKMYVLPWTEVSARNEISIEHAKYSKYAVV